MKILFITTQFPYPLDNGGKVGAINGLKVISKDNKISVLSFTEEPEYFEEGQNYFSKEFRNVEFEAPVIHDIHIRNKPIKLFSVMLKNYLKNLPYITAKFEDFNMYKKIDEMFSITNWDIIFIDYLNMNVYADYIRKKYKSLYKIMILKDHNIEYEIVKQEAEKSIGLKRLILRAEWMRTLAYEKSALENADIVYSVCEENTKFMKLYNSNSFTMSPTYEIKKMINHRGHTHNILFMGNLSWRANMDGLKWFVEKVLPIVRERFADVSLTVVGSGPVENPFFDNILVDYRGYIKDVANIYENHSVFVVPLFEGSGIRIKILEAFNNEIAVVSTNVGCSTIGVKDKRELIIADDKLSFANAVIQLLDNPDYNRKMVDVAKRFLEENFTLEKRQEEFSDHVKNMLSVVML